MCSRKLIQLVSVFSVLALLSLNFGVASAQNPSPTPQPGQVTPWALPPNQAPSSRYPGSLPGPGGHGWYVSASTASGLAPAAAQSTGGPDNYGYTWNDGGVMSWIDATGGTNTGLSQGVWGASVSTAINLGFTFPFYGQAYTQFYISTAGAVGFTHDSLLGEASTMYVPSPNAPNNFIAPYLAPMMVNTTGYPGQVYYQAYGAAPNRSMVVEWSQAKDDFGGTFTFEVVMHENGDIQFNYRSMVNASNWYCDTAAAIENQDGSDGLAYRNTHGCNNMNGVTGKNVLYTYPGKMARIGIASLYQSQFTSANAPALFKLTLTNTGDNGIDTYTLSLNSPWSGALLQADGITPLPDCSGVPCVGPLDMQQSETFYVAISTPGSAVVGNSNSAQLTIHSTLDSSLSKTVTLVSAIPAPFAQTYLDEQGTAPGLILAKSTGQAIKSFAPGINVGSNPIIREIPGVGFAGAWTIGRCGNSACTVYVQEIYVTILDQYGDTLMMPRKIADYTGTSQSTFDSMLALAVTADGHIGLVYNHVVYQASQMVNNLYLVILSKDGSTSYGPTSLTQNTTFMSGNVANNESDPSIAATDDAHFVIAWSHQYVQNSVRYRDLDLAVRDENGNNLLSNSYNTLLPGTLNLNYNSPNVTPLANHLVLLTYDQGSVNGMVLNSSGGVVKANFQISNVNSSRNYTSAMQLSGGNILVGWIGGDQLAHYSILDATTYAPLSPKTIANPLALAGNANLSVTADQADHAILTWSDNDSLSRNLYYALVGSDGTLLTPPVVEATAKPGSYVFITATSTYGATSYTWQLPATADGVITTPPTVPAVSGGSASIVAHIANHGGIPATGVTLTATLDPNLVYLGNNLAITPSINGNTYQWSLPDLGFLATMDFSIQVKIPTSALGTQFPVSLTLGIAGTDADPSNNTAQTVIVASSMVYLPAVLR